MVAENPSVFSNVQIQFYGTTVRVAFFTKPRALLKYHQSMLPNKFVSPCDLWSFREACIVKLYFRSCDITVDATVAGGYLRTILAMCGENSFTNLGGAAFS